MSASPQPNEGKPGATSKPLFDLRGAVFTKGREIWENPQRSMLGEDDGWKHEGCPKLDALLDVVADGIPVDAVDQWLMKHAQNLPDDNQPAEMKQDLQSYKDLREVIPFLTASRDSKHATPPPSLKTFLEAAGKFIIAHQRLQLVIGDQKINTRSWQLFFDKLCTTAGFPLTEEGFSISVHPKADQLLDAKDPVFAAASVLVTINELLYISNTHYITQYGPVEQYPNLMNYDKMSYDDNGKPHDVMWFMEHRTQLTRRLPLVRIMWREYHDIWLDKMKSPANRKATDEALEKLGVDLRVWHIVWFANFTKVVAHRRRVNNHIQPITELMDAKLTARIATEHLVKVPLDSIDALVVYNTFIKDKLSPLELDNTPESKQIKDLYHWSSKAAQLAEKLGFAIKAQVEYHRMSLLVPGGGATGAYSLITYREDILPLHEKVSDLQTRIAAWAPPVLVTQGEKLVKASVCKQGSDEVDTVVQVEPKAAEKVFDKWRKYRCANCDMHAREGFCKCGGCKQVWYCGADCQLEHWNEKHKKQCSKEFL